MTAERFEVLELEVGEARVYDHARGEIHDGGPELVACCDLADELNAKTATARAKWAGVPLPRLHSTKAGTLAIAAKRARSWERAHPEIQLLHAPWHWSHGDYCGDFDVLPPKPRQIATAQEHIARYG